MLIKVGGDIRIPPRSPFGRGNPQPLFVIMVYL
jgi:hypothetical protein